MSKTTDAIIDQMNEDDQYYNELQRYFEDLASKLGCSIGCAQDVWYLRQRSRWTQELEDRLIRLHKEGSPVNINEFGHD